MDKIIIIMYENLLLKKPSFEDNCNISNLNQIRRHYFFNNSFHHPILHRHLLL